jgi:hypothetical protein
MGGALVLNKGFRHDKIKAIILFSPAIGFDNAFTRTFLSFYQYIKRWLDGRQDDLDFVKYETFATGAALQLTKIIDENRAIADRTGKLATPLFAALSYEDKSVSSEKTIRFFSDHSSSSKSRMLLYAKNPESIKLDDSRIEIIKSRNLDLQILDFAHVSILIPPDDTHYGITGEYRSCIHYDKIKDENKWSRCKQNSERVWQGVVSKENMERGVVRRLTYNPLYNDMINYLDQFLNNISGI